MPTHDVRIRIELRGLEGIIRGLEKQKGHAIERGSRALVQEANDIMAESISQVPTETGTLRDSNYIEGPYVSPEEVRVRLGYGGSNDQTNPVTGQKASEYAVMVHERLGSIHPSGNSKFLETPVMQASRSMESRVGSRMQL